MAWLLFRMISRYMGNIYLWDIVYFQDVPMAYQISAENPQHTSAQMSLSVSTETSKWIKHELATILS